MKAVRPFVFFFLVLCLWRATAVAGHVHLPLLSASQLEALGSAELGSLEEICSFFRDNAAEIVTGDLNSHIVSDLSTKLMHMLPMRCLKECGCPQFSRADCPAFRNGLVKFLVQKILTKYPDKEKRLVYVSIGSGQLFLDSVLVSMLLLNGYKNIRIVVMDKVYSGHFLPERRSPAVTQFVQWVSFLSLKMQARVRVIMGDDIHELERKRADVVVAADLDIREEEALHDVISEGLSILKDGGIYGFLVDQPLVRFVGFPLIEQTFKIYRQGVGGDPVLTLSLGLYVGCTGEVAGGEPIIKLPARDADLIEGFGVIIPRIN